jgi:transaldolase
MYIEDLKFSLWADFIEREYLDNEFKALIEKKIINGATSNPAIFKNAILTSNAYIAQLESLHELSPKEKYEAVAIYDIQKAADILRPLYEKGDDGFVSIEVDPYLCDDADATIAEGIRLYNAIGRENVMIKIPATEAGYVALEALVAKGIAVNATLIFKREQALFCLDAFENGMKKAGKDVSTVISIFVSRVDRALDKILAENNIPTALTGIYNSARIYDAIERSALPSCRALFASTGVKGDSLPAHYYIEKLLAYNSVNTAPVETILAFDKDGKKEKALPIDPTLVTEHLAKLHEIGIDLDVVLDKLIADGLEAFKEAFGEILEAL